MSCLVQRYTIFLNLADSHEQDYNEQVLIQQPINEAHFHRSYL